MYLGGTDAVHHQSHQLQLLCMFVLVVELGFRFAFLVPIQCFRSPVGLHLKV